MYIYIYIYIYILIITGVQAKRSMITPEAWTPVVINSQCSSIKWIERSTEYVLPRIQVCMYVCMYVCM